MNQDRPMDNQERHELFSELLIRHQSRVYGYIFALVRNRDDAADLFQSVCLLLWRKFDTFQPGTSFFSWARQTSVFEVRNFLRRKDRLTPASEDLLEMFLQVSPEARSDATELYLAALRRCKAKLDAADAELLDLRYAEDLGTRQIAGRTGRPQNSVCNSLARIRDWLVNCVQREMARQEREKTDLA
jgi:RNA polymerase sigma-70 factor, ECF subfamily